MSRLCRVIDTNVLLVANEQHTGVSPSCITACVRALDHIRSKGIVVIDDGYEILSEYKVRTQPNTGNRVGDAFLKWLYQNAGNPKRVARVKITKHSARGYVEFPSAVGLKDFDPSDRKFVAVAAKHGRRPPIVQAADSKWVSWTKGLLTNGIKVEFLCRSDVEAFLARKQK